MDNSLFDVFNKKYNEFIVELKEVYPELSSGIDAAFLLTSEERVRRFREEVLPTAGNPKRDTTVCPGCILPGVVLTAELWADVSEKTHTAIQEYLTLLSFCIVLSDGGSSSMFEGLESNFNMNAMGDFMNMFKSKLDTSEFANIAEKLGKMFEGGIDASGSGGSGLGGFKLPEKFMNGHLAKFAHEIVRDIKPEDFGLDESTVSQLEKNPSGAIELLMNVFKNKPDFLQNSFKKIGKRIQQKVLSGEIRPQEIAREAEELMKEFINNPAFSGLMETLRSTFGFEDMDFAKAAGKEGSARLAIVKDRLRKKMDAKKAAQQQQQNTFNNMTVAQAQQFADSAAAALLANETQQQPKKSNKRK